MYKEKGIFATKHEKLIEKVVKGKLENFERKEYIIIYVYSIYLSLSFELHRIMFIRILNIMTVWFCIDVSWLL